MKKYLLSYWLIGLFCCSSLAQADMLLHPAQQQLQQSVDSILAVVHNPDLNEHQKIIQVEQYADQYLDYERISALAVGLPWRQFSAQQRQDFIAAFKAMIIRLYAHAALLGANNAEVTVLPKMIKHNLYRVDTFTDITSDKGKHFEVAYQMYLQNGVYRIYNFRVNGASLVTIYRNQFNDLINKKGIDGTIAYIRNKGLSTKNK